MNVYSIPLYRENTYEHDFISDANNFRRDKNDVNWLYRDVFP
jgi:hypothetical protein